MLKSVMTFAFPGILLCLAAMMLASCTGSREAGDDEPFEIIPDPPRDEVRIQVAPVSPDVKTIQLYRVQGVPEGSFGSQNQQEMQFPIITLGTQETLRLEFDLMDSRGVPLSVHFYHADAYWNRDLNPIEYLGRFQRDDLLVYDPSHATEVPYTHYSYEFPNDNIEFLISGNYVVRISEQGNEEEILFERPFFITENHPSPRVGIENYLRGANGFSAIQPALAFVPPAELKNNIYDFVVCFSRNGRFAAPRCTDTPHIIQQPTLRFFLPPSQAFDPAIPDYFLDLSAVRVGLHVTNVDFAVSPYFVTLKTDYARFPGNPLDPVLNGQTVISGVVEDVFNPDVAGQYVDVLFQYVPDEKKLLEEEVSLIGSFNGWNEEESISLSWSAEQEWYEGVVRLKQGHYDYQYVLGKDRIPRGTAPRNENLLTGMVYYEDIYLNTHRLISVGGSITF